MFALQHIRRTLATTPAVRRIPVRAFSDSFSDRERAFEAAYFRKKDQEAIKALRDSLYHVQNAKGPAYEPVHKTMDEAARKEALKHIDELQEEIARLKDDLRAAGGDPN
eukprot:TRINITY_DN2697_c0_g1_i1.p3 TRINITY_DN2697_c0_g1~~TRINITY_DN2697_c0_g1_i1.p3  ORF type:complete len:109 (-),score=42.07 TRINITY_DN2697_c0_g1_i1:194-520(-)